MKILIIVVYYIPGVESCVQLIHDLAHELKLRGHSPTVLTPNDTISDDIQISNEQGVKVVRVKTGKIKGSTKYIRALNEIRLSNTIWRKAKKYFLSNSFDLILYYSPTIFFGSLVSRLKEIYNCKSYLILRDIFPRWVLDAGILKKGLLYNYFEKKELQNYNAADIIGVQSPADLDYFMNDTLDKRYTCEVLFNWINLSQGFVSHYDFRDKLGLGNKIILFYGGNIGVAQDIDNIVRVAVRLKDVPEAHLLLVGEGTEVPRLKKEIQKIGLNNFSIHPAVNQQDYMRMVADIDIGMISLDRNLKNHNYPGKMLGYMFCEKPILASINPGNDLQNFLQTHGAGFVCNNGEDDVFYHLALKLIKDPDLRVKMGKNGRILLENTFSVSAAVSQVLSHFSN